MCEPRNSTVITGVAPKECRFCASEVTCNVFKRSFTQRCQWEYLPGRIDYWGVRDGLCTDGLDFPTLSLSPWIMIMGWTVLIFLIGLIRKERGPYASLRRHGVIARAKVMHRTLEPRTVQTAETLPDMPLQRYFVTARWQIKPSYYTLMGSGCRWKWLRYKAWRSWQQWQGTPAGDQPWARTTVATVQGMGMDEKARHRQAFEQADTDGDGLLDKQELAALMARLGRVVDTETLEEVWAIMDEDGGGTVTWDEFDRWFGVLEDTSRTRFDAEKVIQVSEETWESLLEANSTVKVMYDPLTEGSAMPLEAIRGQPTPFWLLYALSLTLGGSLITMGLVMVIDTFHCGHHFWGFPNCCAHCDDWIDGVGKYGQKCFRGGCDGLGGRTHLYWCESECEVTWALLPIPTAFAGILLALSLVQLRNSGAVHHKTRTGRVVRYLCGGGKFCCPTQPPSLYLEEEYLAETKVKLSDDDIVLGYHRMP